MQTVQAVASIGVGLVLGDERGGSGAVLYFKGSLKRSAGIGRAVTIYLGKVTEKTERHTLYIAIPSVSGCSFSPENSSFLLKCRRLPNVALAHINRQTLTEPQTGT